MKSENIADLRTELGKIVSARVGFLEGYSDSPFGFWVRLEGRAWAVNTGFGLQIGENAEPAYLLAFAQFIAKTLRAAKKLEVESLIGVPIEATFSDGAIKSWRILEEVL